MKRSQDKEALFPSNHVSRAVGSKQATRILILLPLACAQTITRILQLQESDARRIDTGRNSPHWLTSTIFVLSSP